MTYADMMRDLEKYIEAEEAYKRGEIDSGMTEEEHKDWIEKCNA